MWTYLLNGVPQKAKMTMKLGISQTKHDNVTIFWGHTLILTSVDMRVLHSAAKDG